MAICPPSSIERMPRLAAGSAWRSRRRLPDPVTITRRPASDGTGTGSSTRSVSGKRRRHLHRPADADGDVAGGSLARVDGRQRGAGLADRRQQFLQVGKRFSDGHGRSSGAGRNCCAGRAQGARQSRTRCHPRRARLVTVDLVGLADEGPQGLHVALDQPVGPGLDEHIADRRRLHRSGEDRQRAARRPSAGRAARCAPRRRSRARPSRRGRRGGRRSGSSRRTLRQGCPRCFGRRPRASSGPAARPSRRRARCAPACRQGGRTQDRQGRTRAPRQAVRPPAPELPTGSRCRPRAPTSSGISWSSQRPLTFRR